MNYLQPYPVDRISGGGGYYGIKVASGLLPAAIAAGDTVFSFMFPPDTGSGRKWRAQLKYLRLFGVTRTAYGAAQLIGFDVYKARSFTVADSAGTAVAPVTLDQKRQKGYADSRLLAANGGDLRISSTAKLTVGTRTVEALPFAGLEYWSGAIGASGTLERIFNDHSVPVVFEPNEGIVIQNEILLGATGVTQLYLTMEWMEEVIGTHGW